MDAWCALWFWPLDRVGLLDGTEAKYAADGGVFEAGPAPVAPEPEAAAASGPAPGDVVWRAAGLFDDPDGEQGELDADAESDKGLEIKRLKIKGRRATGRQAEIAEDTRRSVIPLKTLADWLDFLELTLGTKDADAGSFLDGLDDLPVDEALPLLETYERSLDGVLGMDSPFKLNERFPWLHTVEEIAGTTERDIKTEDGHGFFHWELHFAHVFRGAGVGSTFRWGIRLGSGRGGRRTRCSLSTSRGSCSPRSRQRPNERGVLTS